MVVTKTFKEPPICKREILRYAGCKEPSAEIETLLEECLEEVREKLSYRVCYMELPLSVEEDVCDFGCMRVKSKGLAKCLGNNSKTILFAATIGVEIDRLIAKYGRISPSKALMFQAIGAERIEALCDEFCQGRKRFSPGYGDLSLETQKDIVRLLDCAKQIGVSLNDSMLMSPSKSVTAFMGEEKSSVQNKCAVCEKTDCQYRGM